MLNNIDLFGLLVMGVVALLPVVLFVLVVMALIGYVFR